MQINIENLIIEDLWKIFSFSPNDKQKEAIFATKGSLFLAAGPGAGKTRVLLWRTVNLIVFEGCNPDEIFLSTFTEKAAKQLKDGLQTLLNTVTSFTGKQYDISRMYIGTVHSLCQKLITDRRLIDDSSHKRVPVLLDELDQYFYISEKKFWEKLLESADFTASKESYNLINKPFGGQGQGSKHKAITNLTSIFNRFSEEFINPENKLSMLEVQAEGTLIHSFLKMYSFYLNSLKEGGVFKFIDFSLLQQYAFIKISENEKSKSCFKHIIIDEYQDTNTIQEKIFFHLASHTQNFCVVGDDDQSLYRFRGARVDNFVQFQSRIVNFFPGTTVNCIYLTTNYRSTPGIVDFSQSFLNQTNWENELETGKHFRLHDKIIKSGRTEDVAHKSILKSQQGDVDTVCREIVLIVKELKASGKIDDYSQCAFLFPGIKTNTKVKKFMEIFEEEGIPVYAPRATRFLELDETSVTWGMFSLVFGGLNGNANFQSQDLIDFREWLSGSEESARQICENDKNLTVFINEKKKQIATAIDDYEKLVTKLKRLDLSLDSQITIENLEKFYDTKNISEQAQKNIKNKTFLNAVRWKKNTSKNYTYAYLINRATSLDWTILDLFYQLSGFDYFKKKFDLAEKGDEGPICNLSLVTQYLARFIDKNSTVITASFLRSNKFSNVFFGSFTYALYRLGESEYESKDDPFPRGRVPFLTIHQSKGLEFPVVVLGNLTKKLNASPDYKEQVIYELQETNGEAEPLAKISEFDATRVFYVGITRAQNLLILPDITGRGQSNYLGFRGLLNRPHCLIKDFDLNTLPVNRFTTQDIGKAYSYTGDFLNYKKCPRQYMTFKRLGFIPSRSQTMFFGRLVHQTIEDLHQFLISLRKDGVKIIDTNEGF